MQHGNDGGAAVERAPGAFPSSKGFERAALGLIVVLVAALVGATVLDPPGRGGAPAKATLRLSPSLPVPPKDSRVREGVEIALAIARPGAGKLAQAMAALKYDLNSVLAGVDRVPRVFLASLPHDMAEIRELPARKTLFFKMVLPLILQVNEEILADRERLWRLRYRVRVGEPVDALERLWLAALAERYGVDRDDVDGLMRRLDVVPPSLALAQSAEESGWGTSRFVREGNALFGRWVFTDDGHLTPSERDDGKNHKVKAFDSLIESVRDYAHNLNTHRAYNAFRRNRAAMRAGGKPVDGLALAGTLGRYSQRGVAYVYAVRSIIAANQLREIDDARLHDREAAAEPAI